MTWRVLAIAILSLCLAACGKPEPQAAAPAVPPKTPANSSAPPVATGIYRPADSPTLKAVRERGVLRCGVHPGLPGFGFPDVRGQWRGLDADICRAVAAAVLGDATKVRFVPAPNQDRFSALQKGDIDLLSRNTSWTFARDAGLGVDFTAVTYYDGQGFLAPKALGLTSAEELSGARVCVQADTASEGNLSDYFRARGLSFKPVAAASEEEARRLYEDEACDVFTADISALAASRSLMRNANAHVILANVISKEPLGPVVRQGDPTWTDIVRWTVYATVLGEELGLTSKTVEQARETAVDPETRRLLGVEGDLGPLLGLSKDWAFQVIRQVGAYHEIFRRDVGADSPLKLERGLNALWNAPKPGLLYAPPMR